MLGLEIGHTHCTIPINLDVVVRDDVLRCLISAHRSQSEVDPTAGSADDWLQAFDIDFEIIDEAGAKELPVTPIDTDRIAIEDVDDLVAIRQCV